MLEVYECWGDENSLSLFLANSPDRDFLTQGQSPLYSIRAASWEEAMQAHNAIQGWGEYKSW